MGGASPRHLTPGDRPGRWERPRKNRSVRFGAILDDRADIPAGACRCPPVPLRPPNAAKVSSEPGAFNQALYDVFTGGDIDFALGGEVAKIPDFRPRLAEIATPTMIVAGRYDRALHPRLQQDFCKTAPQAEFVVLERSGTAAHVEQPDELEALIRRHFG